MTNTHAPSCAHTSENVSCEHNNHHKGETAMTHLPARTVTITAKGRYCRRTGTVTGAWHDRNHVDWIMVRLTDGDEEIGFKAGELA